MKTLILSIVLTLWSTFLLIAQTDLGESYTSPSQKISYLVSVPESYSKENEQTYSTILFLHGGDRSNINHHPKKYAEEEGIEFPFITVAPLCPEGCSWSKIDFDALLNEVSANYRLDKNRIYLTGYSMGGYGAWYALSTYPNWFAAAIPIAGGGKTETVCNAKNIPIKVFHGDKDDIIPYSESVNLVTALKKCNADVELVTINTKSHWIWPNIYRDPEFYSWLLAHKK